MSLWDVVVVGGGPAGSTLAALAAGAGLRVVVVERERFPRDKVCGEFLSPEGVAVLERLGISASLRDAGVTRMDSCRISSPRGRTVESRLPDLAGAGRAAMGVSRGLLDTTLLGLARRRGAKVYEQREATAPLTVDGRVTGVRIRPVGSEVYGESLRAPVVVAADGRRSALVRCLHPHLGDPTRSGPASWFGIKAHLHGDPSRLGTRVELHLFDGGYAGIGTVESGLLNLCVMVTVRALRASGGSPERLLREGIVANPAAREILEGTKRATPWKSVGPLRFGARRAAGGGVLFVGDAAGTIDPFSGEGMGNALRSAEIALPFVLAAVERAGLTSAIARGYRNEWRKAFAGVTRRVRLLGLVLERPALASTALAVLSRAGGPVLPALVSATRTGLGRSSLHSGT